MTRREILEFNNYMHRKSIRVNTESPTRILEDSLGRITYLRALKEWILKHTDIGFVKERGRVLSDGAIVFFDELGFIRHNDSILLSGLALRKKINSRP